jgi:hypothetical protein
VSRPLSEAIEGLVGTATDWADAAADHAATVARHLDDRVYAADADALSADVAKSVALVARGWAQATGALLEAAVKIAEPPRPVRLITTDRFPVPPGEAPRRLAAAGRTWRSPAGAEMATWRVSFTPPVLREGDHHFRMVVDATGLPGTAYVGKVEVTDPHARVTQVDVVVQVS